MEQIQQFFEGFSTFPYSNYCETTGIHYGVMCSLIIGTICLVLNIATREYSWVDRLWPILPIFHGAFYLYHQHNCTTNPISTRQVVMLAMVTLWGSRLTYNFFRKGGFTKGGEDYRWIYIRQNYHWILVELLNFFFIAYYQNILIQWFSSPIYSSYLGSFNTVDYLLSLAWILLFVGEVISDQQMWDFQSQKYRLLKENGNNLAKLPHKYRIGFITDGLFKYSRHPNFFCQISMWYVMFFFSLNSAGLNWTGVGAVLLHLLFFGSTALTEKISAGKYPKYIEYQKTTSKFLPLPPSKEYQNLKQD